MILVRQDERSALKQADEELIPPPMLCAVLRLEGNVNYILLCCFTHIKQNSPSAQPQHTHIRTYIVHTNQHANKKNLWINKDIITLLQTYISAIGVST